MSDKASIIPSQSHAPAPATAETASAAVSAQAKAIVEARYVIALRQPRDLDVVREKLLKECKRPGFAEVARYNKPIGDGIVGPSIRFAEACLRIMGNIVQDNVTLYDDREKRIVQVNVTDLEGNTCYTSSITIDKTVERRKIQPGDEVLRERKNSKGDLLYVIVATEDQILNKANALVSKAIRTNVLRLVPGDIVEECMWQVVRTQKDADAKDPDGAKLKLFDAFGSIGVTVAQIKQYLGHDGANLQPKELADLRALHTAIKEGEATWKGAMDAKEATKGNPAGTVEGALGSTGVSSPTGQNTAEAGSKMDPAQAKKNRNELDELALDLELTEGNLIKMAVAQKLVVPAVAKTLGQLPDETISALLVGAREAKRLQSEKAQ